MRLSWLPTSGFLRHGLELVGETPVSIVSHAAMAAGAQADGRVIPHLVLDTTARDDLAEAIRTQATLPGGDVQSMWTRRPGRRGFVTLLLRFQRPAACKAVLEFDIVEQGKLVEAIVTAQGLCILAGQPGDGFVHDADRPAMSIEIPEMGFRQVWDELYASSLYKRFRGRGLTRAEARDAIEDHLTEARRVLGFRMR